MSCALATSMSVASSASIPIPARSPGSNPCATTASQSKILWLNQSVKWGTLDSPSPIGGRPFSTVGAVIWMDDGKPWAVLTVEDVVYNVDVKDYIRARGQ